AVARRARARVQGVPTRGGREPDLELRPGPRSAKLVADPGPADPPPPRRLDGGVRPVPHIRPRSGRDAAPRSQLPPRPRGLDLRSRVRRRALGARARCTPGPPASVRKP